MSDAYANRISTVTPDNDVHRFFIEFAASQLSESRRHQNIFTRMAERSGIEHRFSCFTPAVDPNGASLDEDGIFLRGAFPGTGKRMEMFAEAAPTLAVKAVERLLHGENRTKITQGKLGCAMAFGPGLTAETMMFCMV
jgi:predicted naringenin-chalcone synthase